MLYKLENRPTRNKSPRSKYGGAKKPKGITLHHWGSDGQKHQNVVDWLRGYTGNRGSSAHEVISDGLVTVLAPGDVATWHSGNNVGNGTTMGLELRPEMSDGDWATLVQRCTDLEEQWGSLQYWEHNDWKATACPGRYSGRIGELVEAVNAEHERRKNGSAPKKRPAPKKKKKTPAKSAPPFPLDSDEWFGEESKDPRNHSGYWEDDRPHIRKWQTQMKKTRGWNEIKITGRFTARDAKVLRQFQKEKGLRVDGGLGPQAWAAAWESPVT